MSADRLSELQKQEESMRCEIETIRERLKPVAEEILEIKIAQLGLAVGQIVTSRGDEYLVSRVVPDYKLVYGMRRNKGGEWSKREQCLFCNWEPSVPNER